MHDLQGNVTDAFRVCTVRREEREGKVSFDPKMSISTQKQIGIRRGKKKKTSSIENFGRPPPSEKERRPKRGVIEKSRGNRARTCPRPIYPRSPTRYSRERMLFARAFHPKPSRRIPDPRFCSRFLRSARKKNKSASLSKEAHANVRTSSNSSHSPPRVLRLWSWPHRRSSPMRARARL